MKLLALVPVVQSADPAGSGEPGLTDRGAAAPGLTLPVHRARSDFGARHASQRDVIAALTVSQLAHVQLGPADVGDILEPEALAPLAATGLRA